VHTGRDRNVRLGASTATDLVAAWTDEGSGDEEQQGEQQLTLQQLDDPDDDEDDGE
jgi:hypothetical protein